MTASPGHRDADQEQARALREAVDWSILLDDDAGDDDLQARFQRWLDADPAHRQAWQRTSDVSTRIRAAAAQAPATAPATVAAPALPASRPRRRAWRRALLASAAAAAVAWLVAPQLLLQVRADYVTGAGEQRTLALADGSTIRLAPGSAVRVAYAGVERRVELLAGEAFFEVVHDPQRPFRVDSDAVRVTVLGTGFDVRLDPSGGEVAVRHGRVRVDAAAGMPALRSVLEAGQWARLDRSGGSEQGRTVPSLVGSWSARRLSAVDRPLAAVLADLGRYYRGQIVLVDPALGRRRVTGIFDVDDPAHAAQLMVRPHGGVVRRLTPWLLVVSRS
jgi:transmembrane sensor